MTTRKVRSVRVRLKRPAEQLGPRAEDDSPAWVHDSSWVHRVNRIFVHSDDDGTITGFSAYGHTVIETPDDEVVAGQVFELRDGKERFDHFPAPGRPSLTIPNELRAAENRLLREKFGSPERVGGVRSGEARRARGMTESIQAVAESLMKSGVPRRSVSSRVVAALAEKGITVTVRHVRRVLR